MQSPPDARPSPPARSHRFTVGIVHPGALPVTVYQALAAALGPEVALDVLEVRFTGSPAELTVDRMARWLVDDLGGRRVDLLAGWSFGGVVALAAAEQLAARTAAQTAAPQHVVLLDTVAPRRLPIPAEHRAGPVQVLGWFCMLLGARVGKPFPLRPGSLHGTLDEALVRIREQGLEQRVIAPDLTVGLLRQLFAWFADGARRNGRLADAYRPARLPARLTLVRPEHSLFPDSPSLGWHAYANGALTIRPCPGDHYSLLTAPSAISSLAALFRGEAGVGAAGPAPQHDVLHQPRSGSRNPGTFAPPP
jgi:thioesterase domain-containing protein